MLRKRLFLPTFVFFVIAFVTVALSLKAKFALAQSATPVNFKVAFIGDSGRGSGQKNVLNLIKAEGADMVIHEGDFSYDSVGSWTSNVDSILGANFPYLGSIGNHDANNWGDIRSGCTMSTFAGYFRCKLQKMGVTPELTSHNELYAVTYKGLRIVFANENPKSIGANWVNQKLSGDPSIWKICSWHKNQKAMQVGGKGDSVGWEAYENCRKQGAIIATGHEHSYERTKTLTSTTNQTVDPSCSGRNNLCVEPGRTFVFVAGTGGAGLRNQDRCLPTSYPYGCKGEWASIYTTDQGAKHGALFIEFNVGGNPNRAHGYFKNVNGQVIDDFLITKGSAPPGPTATPVPTKKPTPTPTPKPPTPTPTPTPKPLPGCQIATSSWKNFPISSQSGKFSVEYDVIPNSKTMNALIALSSKTSSKFDDFAALVRFNLGIIDVRNGGSYSFDNRVPFTAGKKYHFQEDVDVRNHAYTVWVTPEGGSRKLLARDYSFRSTQLGITSIANWGIWSGVGSPQVCNFKLVPTPKPGAKVDLSLVPSANTVVPGDKFSVDVVMNTNGLSVSAAEIHISFESNFLEAQSIKSSGFLPVVLPPGPKVSAGKASIILGSSPSAPKKGTGVIATVNFRAKQASVQPVGILFASGTQVAAIGFAGDVTRSLTSTSVSIIGPKVSTPTPSPTPPIGGSPSPTPPPTPTKVESLSCSPETELLFSTSGGLSVGNTVGAEGKISSMQGSWKVGQRDGIPMAENGKKITVDFPNSTILDTVLIFDNDPKSGEQPWSINGTSLPVTGGGKWAPPFKLDTTVTQMNFDWGGDSAHFNVCIKKQTKPTGTPPLGVNLIRNHSFEKERGETPTEWTVFAGDGTVKFFSEAPSTDAEESGIFSISKVGTRIQLSQPGITLEANTSYVLTFDAFSNTGHDIQVLIHKDGSPSTNYGLISGTLDLTTSFKSFTLNFTTNDLGGRASVSDARLVFLFAPYATDGDVYHIDNVVLRKGGAAAVCPRLGDVNCDGSVNIVDIGIVVDAFDTSPPDDDRADLDDDDDVDIDDIGIVIDDFDDD